MAEPGPGTNPTSIASDLYASRVGDEGRLPSVQEEICRRVMEGESVRSICSDEQMPAKSTVFAWLAQDVNFRQAYVLAKQILAEQYAEEIISISDDSTGDYVETDRGMEVDRENVQRSRLRVDSRKWLAGKLAPKRYGDASTINVNDVTEPKPERTTAERFARLAAMAQRALAHQPEEEPDDDE